MIPFKETIQTKEELIEACKNGFKDYTDRKITKNDFCMYFGFTHGEAITKFYEGNYEQLLVDGGFNTGSIAYFAGGIKAWKNLRDGLYVFPPISDCAVLNKEGEDSLQTIYYGAPGTGKSFTIDQITNKDNSIRTTFHPDSDYSTFVGAYKPIMEDCETRVVPVVVNNGISLDQNNGMYKERKISYNFVPQAFIKAYAAAWSQYAAWQNAEGEEKTDKPEPYYLVVEEINRGNCAQIFGDLFQLLDRGGNGFSCYAISPDNDIQKYLAETEFAPKAKKWGLKDLSLTGDFKSDNGKLLASAEEIMYGKSMLLPSNLHILATMNTSDQSLFPIDSAFKRRWDWKYMKIKDAGKGWKIDVKNGDTEEKLDWWEFLRKINKVISSMTSSADKQLGYFFCKPDKPLNEGDAELKLISSETFVGKVVFYLWNDVFKDYGFEDNSLFQYEDANKETQDLTFPDFYKDDDDVDENVVKQFVDNVMGWSEEEKGK